MGFRDLINRVCGQGQRKAILEHFKARFCAAASAEYWPSTNERFASEDLDRDSYQLDPPMLIATRVHIPINVPDAPPSLDVQAQAIINQSLDASQRSLSEGNGRLAVQEVLWLLETISTAFRGPDILDGSIQGRYFNKIVGELRQRGRGHQEQILQWMMTLHGYLSSPTGGGVRHGVDLKDGLALQIDEARLYCNLIRSYLTFLIAEHKRLVRRVA